MNLIAKSLAELPPEGKLEHWYWDDDPIGFGYQFRRSHPDKPWRKTWWAQYRNAAGKTRKTKIGPANVVSESKARAKAREILSKVTLGADPQAERAAQRQASALTLRKVVDTFLGIYQRTHRRSSFTQATRYLTGPYYRPLHSMAVSEIAFADVAAQLRKVEADYSPSAARAARKNFSQFFSWMTEEGLLGRNPINPVVGTRQPAAPPARERVLSNDELVAVWKTTEDDPQSDLDLRAFRDPRWLQNWRDYCRCIRLLVLLGARRGEIGGMTWSELNLDTGMWTLPAARSKNHRSLVLALPPLAREIIASVPRRAESDRLFGTRQSGLVKWEIRKHDLDDRLGDQVKPWRVHDLRRSMATGMADIGVAPHVIEATLNHHSGFRRGVASVYNKSSYDREVAAALVRWSEHVMALVEGRQADNVISLRGAS